MGQSGEEERIPLTEVLRHGCPWKGTFKGDLNDDKKVVLGGVGQEHSWWKELQQRSVYLRVARRPVWQQQSRQEGGGKLTGPGGPSKPHCPGTTPLVLLPNCGSQAASMPSKAGHLKPQLNARRYLHQGRT